MVDVTSVQTLHQKLPGEPKVFAGSKRFFVYIFSCEVFRNTTVVSVTQLCLVVTVVEQIINIYIVYISLDLFHIHLILLGFGLLIVTLLTTAI